MTFSTCGLYNADMRPTCEHPGSKCDPGCKHYVDPPRTLGGPVAYPRPALRARAVHRKLFIFVTATLAAIVAVGYVLGEWLQ